MLPYRGCDYRSHALRRSMVDGPSDDDIIRERAFRISDKLDLGDLVDDSKFIIVKESEDDRKDVDDAIGGYL